MAINWYCPHCESWAKTVDSKIPMHKCNGLRGWLTPLIPKDTKGESRLIEREDYMGKETVQTDSEQRPVMAVVTERDQGQDCTIFAPCVSVGIEAKGT